MAGQGEGTFDRGGRTVSAHDRMQAHADAAVLAAEVRQLHHQPAQGGDASPDRRPSAQGRRDLGLDAGASGF
jgi:hypothetical protein